MREGDIWKIEKEIFEEERRRYKKGERKRYMMEREGKNWRGEREIFEGERRKYMKGREGDI